MLENSLQNGGNNQLQSQGSPHVVDLRLLYKEPAPQASRVLLRARLLSGLATLRSAISWLLGLIGLPAVYSWLGAKVLVRIMISFLSYLYSFAAKSSKELLLLCRHAKIKIRIGLIKFDLRRFRIRKPVSGFAETASVVEENFAESFSNFKINFNNEVEDFEDEMSRSKTLILRPLVGFVIVLFILILPFKGFSYFESLDDLRLNVLTSTTAAVKELFSAGQSAKNLDLKAAGSNFAEASKQFASAEAQLGEINSLLFDLAKLLPIKDAKMAGYSKAIVEAGMLLSDVGLHLTRAVDGVVSGRTEGLGASLNNFTSEGELAVDKASQLSALIESIKAEDMPSNYQATFAELKGKAKLFNSSLSALVAAVEKLKIFAGMERDTRYLLVFQNNAEMRASGGFFGSYALLDFSKGRIKNLEVPAGGTYDVEAGYHDRIIAPTPLQMVNPLWHLWDANWWYDWPTTARKLSWFYEKSGGPTVDGVISLTPTVIEDFLRAYGPVDMTKDYGVTITVDNFWQVTQTFAEQKPDVTNKPKQIIGDLFNAIITDFPNRLNKPTLLKIVLATEKSFDEKQALLYFKNEELAEWVRNFGWDGQVKQTSQDYLAVINSSVGGGKSDREIIQKISHQATILADGSIIDEVEIIRSHPVQRGAQFTGVRNVDWLRVYVPQGSELIEASGFRAPDQKYFEAPDPAWTFDGSLAAEDKNFQVDSRSGTKIYQELGKSVFANWSMIDPGESARIYFKYKLPFKATKVIASEWPAQVSELFNIKGQEILTYGLLAQKQPGSLNTSLMSVLNSGPYFRAHPTSNAWHYPDTPAMSVSEQGWQIELPFTTDQFFAILQEKK